MKNCSNCKIEKSEEEFNKKNGTKDGLQYICKPCDRARAKNLYAQNKEEHKRITAAKKKDLLKLRREFVFCYLEQHPCVDCGESDIRCLEFDHVRGEKEKNLSSMIQNVNSLDKIKKEIEKCEVRCANCHRKRTSDIQGWYKTSRSSVVRASV